MNTIFVIFSSFILNIHSHSYGSFDYLAPNENIEETVASQLDSQGSNSANASRPRIRISILVCCSMTNEKEYLMSSTKEILDGIKEKAFLALTDANEWPENTDRNRSKLLGRTLNFVEIESDLTVIQVLTLQEVRNILCKLMIKTAAGMSEPLTSAVVLIDESEMSARQRTIHKFLIRLIADVVNLPVIIWSADNLALFEVFSYYPPYMYTRR